MNFYRTISNDTGQAIEFGGNIDLTTEQVEAAIREMPTAFWMGEYYEGPDAQGVTIKRVVDDEDGVIEAPLDPHDWHYFDNQIELYADSNECLRANRVARAVCS